jgi:hypothetical protein
MGSLLQMNRSTKNPATLPVFYLKLMWKRSALSSKVWLLNTCVTVILCLSANPCISMKTNHHPSIPCSGRFPSGLVVISFQLESTYLLYRMGQSMRSYFSFYSAQKTDTEASLTSGLYFPKNHFQGVFLLRLGALMMWRSFAVEYPAYSTHAPSTSLKHRPYFTSFFCFFLTSKIYIPVLDCSPARNINKGKTTK